MSKKMHLYTAALFNIYEIKAFNKKMSEVLAREIRHEELFICETVDFKASVKMQLGYNNSLLAIHSKEKDKRLVALFPFLRNDNSIKIKLEKITENEDKATAILEGTAIDEVTISFFDPLYFLNKDKYLIGKYYRFNINALVYDFEKAEYPENDEVTMKGMNIYISDPTYKDDFVFAFPYDPTYTSETKFEGTQVVNIQYFLPGLDKRDVPFSLVINKELLMKVDPKKGEDVVGKAWLQGYLEESFVF